MKIDYWAQVNLGGFVYLVDSVGGVNLNVTDGFCDPRYKEYGIKGFNITPGRYHMDGEEALAYARVRKAAGESDFTRAGRQQEVIGALRDQMVRGEFLDNPSRFLRSIGQTITTNIRPSVIADYIAVATEVGRKDVFRAVIDHPLVKSGYDARGSIQIPQVKRIRALADRLFTATGVRPKGFDTMPDAGSGPTKNASSRRRAACRRSPGRRRGRRRSQPPNRPRSRPSRRRRHPSRRPRRRRPRAPPSEDARAAGGRRPPDTPCPGAVLEIPDPSLVVLVGAAGRARARSPPATSGPTRSSRPTRSARSSRGTRPTSPRRGRRSPPFTARSSDDSRGPADGRGRNERPGARAGVPPSPGGAAGIPGVAIVLDLPAAIVRDRNAGRVGGRPHERRGSTARRARGLPSPGWLGVRGLRGRPTGWAIPP